MRPLRQSNFISQPVITSSVISEESNLCLPLTQEFLYSDSFYVYNYEDATAARMNSLKCTVHCSATFVNIPVKFIN
jgi:hypothetical protein